MTRGNQGIQIVPYQVKLRSHFADRMAWIKDCLQPDKNLQSCHRGICHGTSRTRLGPVEKSQDGEDWQFEDS